MPAYKRILLKLSGEALMGDDAYGINRSTIVRMVREVQEVTQLGCEVAVVIGGGNIFRGVAGGSVGMDRATADYMGMLATVINALALQDAMNRAGLSARVQSALNIEPVVEPYIRGKAIRYLEEIPTQLHAIGDLPDALQVELLGISAPVATMSGCLAGTLCAFAAWLLLGRPPTSQGLSWLRHGFVSTTTVLLNGGGVAVVMLHPEVNYHVAWVVVRAVVFGTWNYPLLRDVMSGEPARA